MTRLNPSLSGLSTANRRRVTALLAEVARREGADAITPKLTFEEWLPKATPAFTWNWRHQLVVQGAVRRVLAGDIDRLMISMPPRHGKSELVTVRLPAYKLEHDPTFRWMVGAYSQTLANKFSRKTRSICRSRGVELSTERRAVDDWETADSGQVPGGYRAAGVGGGIAGMGANGIIVDDPVKNRAEANSQTYRDATYDWYLDDLLTRIEPGGFVILIMTRWHEDDLAGRLLKEQGSTDEDGGEWTVINLPAIADAPDDILGRRIGEALCPPRYDEKALARIKRALGSSFEALFQGRPVAAEGNLVKRQWFRYYGTPPADNVTLATVQSWDTANKPSELSAYSVCTTWKITRIGVYLFDVYRDRVDYPGLKRAAISEAKKHKPTVVLIEDKASGQSLIQDLKASTQLPVVAIEPEGDKVTRMAVETAAYESGQVLHPESAPWLTDFEAELTSFPLAADADQVDSVSQFLRWARKRAWIYAWDSNGQVTAAAEAFGLNDKQTNHGWGSIGGSNDFGGF